MLNAIVSKVEVPLDRWPGEALKAIIGRFGRMYRGGLGRLHSIYCGRFSSILLDKFKKRANCQQWRFNVLSEKVHRRVDKTGQDD